MKSDKLFLVSFVHALATLGYIAFVSTIMQHAERIFGEMNTSIAPIAFLLLFVVSATITASLVLGRSLLMYLEGEKKDAVRLFLYILGWLFLFLCITLSMSIFMYIV